MTSVQFNKIKFILALMPTCLNHPKTKKKENFLSESFKGISDYFEADNKGKAQILVNICLSIMQNFDFEFEKTLDRYDSYYFEYSIDSLIRILTNVIDYKTDTITDDKCKLDSVLNRVINKADKLLKRLGFSLYKEMEKKILRG